MISVQDIDALRMLIHHMDQSRIVDPSILRIDRHRISSLKSKRLLRSIDFGPSVYVFPDAQDVVSAFDKREQNVRESAAKQDAEKKETNAKVAEKERQDRRHDYFVAAFGAVLGALLTLIVEHHGKIIAFVKQFFH